MMTSRNIKQERRGSAVFVTLHRPEKLNALTREMIESLTQLFTELKNEKDVRVIILTGTGDKAFCVGTDIGELVDLSEEAARETSRRGQMLCEAIESSPIPVIAAVNGLAVGGGFELVLSCHLRVAASHAEFSLPETRLGIIPGYGGTQRLAREIGRGRAREIMLTGGMIQVERALRLGLLNKVSQPETLIQDAESLASEIAQLAPLAISACLRAVNEGLDLPLAEGLAIETELFARLFASNDVREGTRAFLEKRKPWFKGN